MIKARIMGSVKDLERVRRGFIENEDLIILSYSEFVPIAKGKAKRYYRWFCNYEFRDDLERRESYKKNMER